MKDLVASSNVYDAADHPDTQFQRQYSTSNNTFYNNPSSINGASSNFPSYGDFAPSAPQQQNGRLYNVHQQPAQELQRNFTNLPQGSRHTLPSNLNPNGYYSSNQDVEHRVASYPSTAYSGHLSGQFNNLSAEAADIVPEWFIHPPNFDPGGYHRSSTLSNSSFATSAARNSGTSFATTASTRSSLVSSDTYGPTKYEDFSSVYVPENDSAQPIVPDGSVSDPARPFQCTYHCGKTFAKRHEWKRHEDSIHESQWKYICKPEIIYPGMICQFCQCVADTAHLELNHQNRLCQEMDDKIRHTFTRKDKFQLHIHSRHCPNHKAKKQWQKWAHPTDPRPEGYGCGFCKEYLPSWNVRAKHIGDHFEKDAPRFTMDRWDKSFDIGTFSRHSESQSTYASNANSQSADFYAESKALSDGESQAHTPPGPQYTTPRPKNMSSAAASSNRRLFLEEEDVYMDEDPGGETLFGDDMDYVE